MKNQFQSTEPMKIRFNPFIDKVAGDLVIGTDTCSLLIKKPDGTTYTGAVVAAAFDAGAEIWYYDIPFADYVQGEWRVKAASNAANTMSQRAVYFWGDYVNNIGAVDLSTVITPLAALNTKVGTPAGASVSADIAAVKTSADLADTRLGTPAGASVSADIAAAKTSADGAKTSADLAVTKIGTPVGVSIAVDVAAVKTSADGAKTSADSAVVQAGAAKTSADNAYAAAAAASNDVALLRKIEVGRWKIQGTQLILFDLDGVTELQRFNLFDSAGAPSSTRIYERVPV